MTAVPEISPEQIEGLGRRLYLADEKPSAEDIAEYEDFVRATTEAVAEHESARILLASYLGIIERGEVEKLAAEAAAKQPSEAELEARRAEDRAEAAEEAEEDLIEEFRVLVSEATEFDVDFAVADKIFTDEARTLHEAKYWGPSDTVVREGSYSAFSQALIGRDWPTYGDGFTDDELEGFIAELKVAHDELLAELQQTQTDRRD